jgi:hypothetical protein
MISSGTWKQISAIMRGDTEPMIPNAPRCQEDIDTLPYMAAADPVEGPFSAHEGDEIVTDPPERRSEIPAAEVSE